MAKDVGPRKPYNWNRFGVFALLLMAVLSIVLGSFAPPSRRVPRDADLEQRYAATNALLNACAELWFDSHPKPGGESCTSISNAVNMSLIQHEFPLTWRVMTSHTNGFIHLNPDWNKWVATATNEHAFTGELAAYCSPAIIRTNKDVFLGVTFDHKFVLLTNPPAWPRTVDLVP